MTHKKEGTAFSSTAANGESADSVPAYKTTIANHNQAAAHHAEAAKHHLEAAKAYAEGKSEKAAYSAMLAWGHHAIAGEFINDDAKHHAQMLKQTNYR